jgi:hypothetical protein
MAVFTEKSTLISNRDATPKVFTDNLVSGGDMKESEGYITTGSAADSVGSIYRLCTVPSRARVSQVLMSCTALGAGGAIEVGVYWPDYSPFPIGPFGVHPLPGDPGTAIDANLFASALSVAAAQSMVDITDQSGNNTIQLQEMSLWQAAGLAADPGIDLDICAQVTTVLAAAGQLALKVRFQS